MSYRRVPRCMLGESPDPWDPGGSVRGRMDGQREGQTGSAAKSLTDGLIQESPAPPAGRRAALLLLLVASSPSSSILLIIINFLPPLLHLLDLLLLLTPVTSSMRPPFLPHIALCCFFGFSGAAAMKAASFDWELVQNQQAALGGGGAGV
ncbi:unnamed protein product [Pleuronectes platessa]|uniref:Uncharacterized protein n=1 Tax=Pleuronectes platessa TaxID=8262 RepID=A0A9N7UCP2_PLEPL|nr:unnamed protein product [Pleuronectes platessa]